MKKIFAVILVIVNIFLIVGIILYSQKKGYINLKVDGQITKVVLNGDKLSTSLMVPKKENALFNYWSLNGSKYENQVLEDGDTLEAVFIDSYLVTFNPDNGSPVYTTSVYANELVKKIDDPKKNGYKFTGWYLKDKKFDFNQFIDSNIELIAKYEKNAVKVTNPYNKKVNVSSNKQLICKTLKEKGLSDSGVAAIMTNISFESGFNQTDYNGCYGLIQWCGGRFTKLKKYCGNKYSTVECQLKFMFSELNGYSGLLSSLKGNGSASTLTNSFCTKYERPANTKKTCNKRANNSQKIYNYVVNGCK